MGILEREIGVLSYSLRRIVGDLGQRYSRRGFWEEIIGELRLNVRGSIGHGGRRILGKGEVRHRSLNPEDNR